MKTYFALLHLILLTGISYSADINQPYLRISGNGSARQIVWTNCNCATMPIYEVLEANTPGGPWQHVFWLTNTTSFAFPNLPGTNQARYYKLAWQGNDSQLYDFAFYPLNQPDQTCPVIKGWLLININGDQVTGSWYFAPGPCYTDSWFFHLGSGNFCYYNSWLDLNTIQLTLYCGANPRSLVGPMVSYSAGGCSMTLIAGDVYQDGFAGPMKVGTFRATRSIASP